MVKVAGRSRKVPVAALHSGVESSNQTSGEGTWDVGKLAMYFRRSALSIFCCGHSCFTAMWWASSMRERSSSKKVEAPRFNLRCAPEIGR